MAKLSTVYRCRYGVLFWAILECLLFTGIIYGWASLVYILKKDSFFADLCSVGNGDPVSVNSTTLKDHDCAVQDNLLNLAFTIGVFTFTSFGVFAGALLDAFGPRVTRLAACATFCVTGLIFGFMNKDRPMLIFPGVIGLTVSGILLFVSSVQISLMFTRWNSLTASLLNGALDSSSIVMLFFKLISDAGVPLHWIFIGYFIFAVTNILVFTFVLPAELIRVENVEKILEEKESDSECLIEEEESDNESEESLKELFEQTDQTRDALEIKKGSFREFWKIVTSPMYLLLIFYLSIHKLRLWFYIGSMDIFLRFASENNLEAVDIYINSFGAIQFMGIVFSPIVGLIMAWRPASRENKTFGFIVAICLTNALNLFLNVLVIVPVIELQVLSFVIQVVLRGFLYSTYAAFILHRFPHCHFGKLYGMGHCIGAIVGSLQFYLFVVVQDKLERNPFWVNVGFLIFTSILYVFPFYIWVITERETKTKQSHPKYKAALKEK